MANYDLHNNLTYSINVPYSDINENEESVSGLIVDLQGYQSFEYLIFAHNLQPTSGVSTWTWVLEYGDESDLADAEVVPDEFIIGEVPIIVATSQITDTSYNFGYVGGKRYVRATLTFTNPTSNALSGYVSATVIVDTPRKAPVIS